MPRKPNYLYELLSSLTEAELASLSALDLKGKELQLFELFCSKIGSGAPTKEEAMAALGISGAHFDKTTSILLKRCYEVLVPQGAPELWVFLRRKYLPRHVYHQFHLEEREQKLSGDSGALAAFYFNAFETLHTMTYEDYDPKEAERFMRCYFELKPNATAAEHIMIEGRWIRQLITNSLSRGSIGEEIRALSTNLATLEAMIDDSMTPLPLCQFYLAIAHFYKVVEIDTDKQRMYLQRTLEVFVANPDDFSTEDIELVKCKIADTYYQDGKFEQAYGRYNQIIPHQIELFKTQYFYTTTFIQLALLCKDFERADSLLAIFYDELLDRAEGQPAAMAAITKAKRYLLERRSEEAKRYIDLGFAINNKNVLLNFDIELRKLESIYFAQIGDFGFTEELIDKHIKFLQSKGIKVKTNLHAIFLKLLRSIMAERSGGKKLSPAEEEQMRVQSSGFVTIYGRLLQTIRSA